MSDGGGHSSQRVLPQLVLGTIRSRAEKTMRTKLLRSIPPQRDQKDFIQQLMGAAAEPDRQTVGSPAGEKEGLEELEQSETPRGHSPQNQLSGTQGVSQRSESLQGSEIGSVHMLCLSSLVFLWDSEQYERGWSLTLLLNYETLFLLLGCLIQPRRDSMCLVL